MVWIEDRVGGIAEHDNVVLVLELEHWLLHVVVLRSTQYLGMLRSFLEHAGDELGRRGVSVFRGDGDVVGLGRRFHVLEKVR